MKKMIVAILLMASAVAGFGQEALDNVIEKAGKKLGADLKGKFALLLDVSASEAEDVGKYITYGLRVQLVKSKNVLLVDRSGIINEEIIYQLSGSVSDETVQSIANQTGAEVVIYGQFEKLGSGYQLSLKAVNIGTTGVPYADNFKIKKDRQLSDLLGESAAVSQQIAGQIKDLEQIEEFGEDDAKIKRPKWVSDSKKYGMLKYENKPPYESAEWVYKVVSASGTSESAAKNAVRRGIQQELVEGISNVFQSVMSSTTTSEQDIYGEYTDLSDVLTQACSAARARVPNYSELQQYTATAKRPDGRTRYTVYQLIRISESDMKAAIASVDIAQIFKILEVKAQELLNGGKIPQEVYNITINVTNNETYITQVNQTALTYVEVNSF